MSMRIGQEVQALLRQRNGPLTYALLPKMWEFHPSPSQNRTRTSARATARRLPPSIDSRIGAWGILNSMPGKGRSAGLGALAFRHDGRARLDHVRLKPFTGRRSIGYASGYADARHYSGADQRHRHDLEVGHTICGKKGTIIHDAHPWRILVFPLCRSSPELGSARLRITARVVGDWGQRKRQR